jgi:hypothetical protein
MISTIMSIREAVRQHDRLGAAIAGCAEQFERAVAGGGRVALARVAAWVAYRGHCTCLRDGDVRVEPRRSNLSAPARS